MLATTVNCHRLPHYLAVLRCIVNGSRFPPFPAVYDAVFLDLGNLIRGRGLLAKAIIKEQTKSPNNTAIYVALVSIINANFPQVNLLICERVISSYRQSFLANERKMTFIMIKFLAHLINQKVVRIFLILMNKTILPLFSNFFI